MSSNREDYLQPTLNVADNPSALLRKALARWDNEGGAIGKVAAEKKAMIDRSSKIL